MIQIRLFVSVLVLILVSGCAAMQPGFEPPVVSVRSIELLPSQGLSPRFRIGLHIVNPNRMALELQGMSYSVSLQGHRVVSGVAANLPVIAGWGEGDVDVTASTDLLSSIRLVAELMSGRRQSISYELNATLDLGSFRPTVRVLDKGEIDLAPARPIQPRPDYSASST